MSKSNAASDAVLNLLLNGTAIANLADNAPSSPATNLYISLHTADPGDAGDQTTNETAYTGYARVAIARTGSGWTVSSGSASPAAIVAFGECTASPGAAITHFAVGTGSSGAGYKIYSGTVTPNITMAVNVTPRLKTTTTVTET